VCVLQYVAAWLSRVCCSMLKLGVLQCVAVCSSVRAAVFSSVLQCVRCSALQCVGPSFEGGEPFGLLFHCRD